MHIVTEKPLVRLFILWKPILERQVLGGKERLLHSGKWKPRKVADESPKTIFEVLDQTEEFSREKRGGKVPRIWERSVFLSSQIFSHRFLYWTPECQQLVTTTSETFFPFTKETLKFSLRPWNYPHLLDKETSP